MAYWCQRRANIIERAGPGDSPQRADMMLDLRWMRTGRGETRDSMDAQHRYAAFTATG